MANPIPEVSLAGKTALVTGGGRGLGLAIAGALLDAGAAVLICGREPAVLRTAVEELRSGAPSGRTIEWMKADVAVETEVEKLVSEALAGLGRLDILVNNAGIYGPKGPVETLDWQAWKQVLEVNLLGSVMTCRAVIPHMKERRSGKIIQISGGGATSPLPNLSAYAASKAAVIRFVESLALEVQPFGIEVNAIAPGPLNTRMLDEVLEAGPEQVGEAFYRKAVEQKNSGGAPLERGAALAAWLASEASDGISGRLLSAVWDSWEELGKFRETLAQSDIYTLRRITPEDRGTPWK